MADSRRVCGDCGLSSVSMLLYTERVMFSVFFCERVLTVLTKCVIIKKKEVGKNEKSRICIVFVLW